MSKSRHLTFDNWVKVTEAERHRLDAPVGLSVVACTSSRQVMSHWLNLQSVGLNVSTWILVTVTCLLLQWIRWRNSRFVRLIDRIPGPKGLPIVGNAIQLAVDKTEFLRIVHRRWVQQFGPIYRGWGGDRPIVCISSPELIEVTLNDNSLLAS